MGLSEIPRAQNEPERRAPDLTLRGLLFPAYWLPRLHRIYKPLPAGRCSCSGVCGGTISDSPGLPSSVSLLTPVQVLTVGNNTVLCLVTQSCPTLCDFMDCSPPGSSVHEDSPGKDTTVGGHVLLQGTFPTQGSNPGLLHCGQILYQLSTREAQEYWSR